MKAFKYISGILTLAMLFLFLPACTDTPIFYTLEKAYSTSDDRGLDDNAVVEKIVYAASANRYFVLAQSVYQRDEGASGTWQRVTPPASGALCGGLEFFGGNIIAWFYSTSDGQSLGLYSRNSALSASDPTWTAITDADWLPAPGEVFRIHFVKEVNSRLFVSTSVYDSGAGTTTYNLYYSPDASDESFIACGGTDPDYQILDIEHYGTSFWLITAPGVSVGDNPTFLYEDDTDAAPDTFVDRSQDVDVPAFWENGSDDPQGTLYMPHSLYYAPGAGNLYLSGWHGRIFIHSGVTWSTWPAVPDQPDRKTVEIGKDDFTVQFTAFVETGQNGQIFAGSAQYGYFYYSDTLDETATLTPGDLSAAYSDYEYFPAELKNGAIRSFLAPADAENTDTMFACTAGAGLWRGDWNAGESLWIWKRE